MLWPWLGCGANPMVVWDADADGVGFRGVFRRGHFPRGMSSPCDGAWARAEVGASDEQDTCRVRCCGGWHGGIVGDSADCQSSCVDGGIVVLTTVGIPLWVFS